MYNVSNEFKVNMKSSAQHRRLFGKIGDIDFTQVNILQGTFTITNQCSDNSNIQIGQAYVGELNATFRGINIPRKGWKGKEIVPYQGLKINDEFEDILLGHYFVDSAKWTKAGIVITAYDCMSNFDKALSLTSASATPYEFITMCCEACNVEFGMTEAQIKAFENGKETLGVFEDNDMESYRDLLAWLAQSLGANAFINREGKLIFKSYSTEVVDNLNSRQRLDGGKFSDFDSFYTGLSVVNIKDQTTSYYGAEVDNGLTMNLGSNPLLQLGADTVLEKQRRNILNAIQKIDYTPLTIRLNTPLIYDLMDVLEFSDGLFGEGQTVKTCITKYTWKFNGDYEIECVGSDPALVSAKSKVDKNIAGLLEQLNTDKTVTYKFTNAQDIRLSETLQKVISIVFVSKERTTAQFLAEILLDIKANSVEKEINGTATYKDSSGSTVTTDTKFVYQEKTHPILEVIYRLNNADIETFVPRQVYHEGEQILTLYYPLLSIPENTSNTFEVYFKLSDGSGEIPKMNIIATIAGQGLVASYYEWDGNINIEETIGKITLNGVPKISVKSFKEKVTIGQQVPSGANITQTIGRIILSQTNISIKGFTESISATEVVKQQTVTFEINNYTKFDDDNYVQLNPDYEYVGQDQVIDDGKLNIVKIETSDKQSIEKITMEVSEV